jgi:hypothetical protein
MLEEKGKEDAHDQTIADERGDGARKKLKKWFGDN